MTALPDWTQLPTDGLTVAAYEALPEEVCRRIEVVDGAIVLNASPRRSHQMIVYELVHVLKAASGPDFSVVFDVDLRLRDVPLLNRRTDVVVYDASVADDAVLRPQHCALVIEVMSPRSITADQMDKPAEYAASGIEHYWRVQQRDDGSA